MTLISIIIPSFRQPQFLGRAIESCLAQDHVELEVIVVDDRSRDASLGLAGSYAHRDPRVRVFEVEENGGLGRSRNIGIGMARGEYLCFLDSDDYLLPQSLSARLAAVPEARGKYGDDFAGVYGDWQHVGETLDYPAVRGPRAVMPVVSRETYTGENVFICSAPLVLREKVAQAGGFPEGLPMLEDFGLWARMVASGAVFVPVHHVVATYRQRPNSMLRGDRTVVMADYVDRINDWMADVGVSLSDGGAMLSWLAGGTPFSHGRMSWNVPSVLGNFGGGLGTDAVAPPSEAMPARNEVDDFMAEPSLTGLHLTPPELVDDGGSADVALVVHSARESLEAVAIAERVAIDQTVARVYAVDPADWTVTWPLALAGLVARDAADLATDVDRIDLADPSHAYVDVEDLAAIGARVLWPDSVERNGAVVYVSRELVDYPARDAWIAVALHALADAGLAPRIVAEPQARAVLGGWRSSVFAFEELLTSELVVAPWGHQEAFIGQLAPMIVFDPSSVEAGAIRSAEQLRAAIGLRRRT